MLRRLTQLGVLLVVGSMIGCCSLHRSPTGCNAGGCAAAGGDCCGNGCHQGLLSPLEELLSCGSGCGEVYWDEWLSDPPDCCDPCDGCGNYVGPQGLCCAPPLNRRNLWGRRHVDGMVTAGAEVYSDDMMYGEPVGESIMGESWPEWMDEPGTPTLAEPVEPAPRSAAAPARPRNVFQHILGPGQPPARTAGHVQH